MRKVRAKFKTRCGCIRMMDIDVERSMSPGYPYSIPLTTPVTYRSRNVSAECSTVELRIFTFQGCELAVPVFEEQE